MPTDCRRDGAVLQLRADNPTLTPLELASMHEPLLTKDMYAGRLRPALNRSPACTTL